MTLINLNFIQFYQLLIKTDLIDKGLFMFSLNDVFVVCEEGYTSTISRFNDEWGELFNDYELIKVLDSIGSIDREEYESFLFFEELMFNVKRV